MRIDKDVKKQEDTQVKEVGHNLGEDVHHEIKVFLCNKDFWVRLRQLHLHSTCSRKLEATGEL